MQPYSDEQLMQLIKEKQSFALRMLYERYTRLVYSFAVKSGGDPQFAEDIVQLVFTRIWTMEQGYDPGKGKFVNWLLTVTRNMTIDQLRKTRNQERNVSFDETFIDTEQLFASSEDELQDEVSRRLARDQIQNAYQYLSVSQIQLIKLFYWEGYTLSEIAGRNREPLGTVKSRLHQALKTLRKHLTPDREE